MKIPPVIDDKYVEEELKKEAEAFASGKGENTGFCLRGLCGKDVSEIDMSKLSIEMFKRLTFDTKTTFSQEQIEKFYPYDIMEQGKQFDNIGESEIDGSGTTIAIIDRFSDISANQFKGRRITVYRVSENGIEEVQPNEETGIYLEGASVEENGLENGFHGNTTDSLAVGEQCGVAPNANVILFHVDGIKNQEAQDAVLKFITKNKEKEEFNIPDILSISAKTDINKPKLKELEKLGCAFINSDIFMKDFTWGRSNDGHELVRDEFIQYTIDAFADRGIDINGLFNENTLIPVTGRTSSYIDDDGEEVYKYNGSFCGNSFAICQVAGLFLLARQINPDISYDKFIKSVKECQKENLEHRMYVDSKDIIEKIKEDKEKNETKGEQFDATLSPEEVVEVSDVTNEFESQLRADLSRDENALENAETEDIEQ